MVWGAGWVRIWPIVIVKTGCYFIFTLKNRVIDVFYTKSVLANKVYRLPPLSFQHDR